MVPIGLTVTSKKIKSLVDMPGGELLVLEWLPAGEKCAKTWSFLCAVADKDGRVTVRGILGSQLAVACKAAKVDLTVAAGDRPVGATVNLVQVARDAAAAQITETVDQAPPARALAGEAALLHAWAKDYLRAHATQWMAAPAFDGYGIDPSWLSMSGYFEAAPEARAKAALQPNSLAAFLSRRSTPGSAPARTPGGPASAVSPPYRPFVASGVSPAGSAASDTSELDEIESAFMAELMRADVAKRVARALVAVGAGPNVLRRRGVHAQTAVDAASAWLTQRQRPVVSAMEAVAVEAFVADAAAAAAAVPRAAGAGSSAAPLGAASGLSSAAAAALAVQSAAAAAALPPAPAVHPPPAAPPSAVSPGFASLDAERAWLVAKLSVAGVECEWNAPVAHLREALAAHGSPSKEAAASAAMQAEAARLGAAAARAKAEAELAASLPPLAGFESEAAERAWLTRRLSAVGVSVAPFSAIGALRAVLQAAGSGLAEAAAAEAARASAARVASELAAARAMATAGVSVASVGYPLPVDAPAAAVAPAPAPAPAPVPAPAPAPVAAPVAALEDPLQPHVPPMAMSPSEAARVGAIRLAISAADADVRALFAMAPDAQLVEACEQASRLLLGRTPPGGWSAWALMPEIITAVAAGLLRAGRPVSELLARHEAVGRHSLLGQLMYVLGDLPAPPKTAGGGGAAAGSGSSVAKAVRRLGEDAAAVSAIAKMHGVKDSEGSELVKLARDAELSSEFGADISFILHQEGLDKIPSGELAAAMPPAAMDVWQRLRDVRPRLLAARVRRYEKLCPAAVGAQALIEAAVTCSLTVEKVTGGSKGDSAAVTANRLMRAWPLLAMVVREVTPRDPTAERALLAMAKDAFDTGASNAADAVRMSIADVFAAMAARAGEYRNGVVAAMPVWADVRAATAREVTRDWVLSGTLRGGGGPPAPANPPPAAAAEKAAVAKALAEEREKHAKALAAERAKHAAALAAAGGGAPAAAPPAAAGEGAAADGEGGGGSPKKKGGSKQ